MKVVNENGPYTELKDISTYQINPDQPRPLIQRSDRDTFEIFRENFGDPNLVNLIQKVGNATIGFEIVQNSTISTLQAADVLIKNYTSIIADHTANNMNRNTTFDTEEEFLDNKTRIVSDLSTKLENYLTTSK